MARRTRSRWVLAGMAVLSGCGFMANLTSMGGAGAAAFSVDMEKYDVHEIDLVFTEATDTWCPGQSGTFKVVAQANKKKKPDERLTLETASASATAADTRGKMDLTEFAMAARGGTVDRGMFTAGSDPFAALGGFDVKATYRNDPSKEVTKHFDPVYACIRSVGGSGSYGGDGEWGYGGEAGGGAGGAGGTGGHGGPGPRLVAYVTIVRTPKYDRVGLVSVTGDFEQLTLFDLSQGITIVARGGDGGVGGRGGDGGEGAAPQGQGGPGGPGGAGGSGGDGGEALIVLDDRYPELGSIVLVDVSGGASGMGGDGGAGGPGGPPPEVCNECETPPPGPDGASGSIGPDGIAAGRSGSTETRVGDLSAMFTALPPGIAMRDDPRAAASPPPPADPTPAPRPRRRRR